MEIGDEVIINPLSNNKVEPGIFRISEKFYNSFNGPLKLKLSNDNIYVKDDLIPADPLEVGDKVVIKKNLGSMESFPHGLVPKMLSYEGKTVTISKKNVSHDAIIGEGIYYYFLQEDANEYYWPLCAFDTTTIIKQSKNYENRLQKQETSVTRRSTEFRFGVRCRKHRARIEVSSLKHKKVIGRG